ncbi:MAG: hypothetical protein FJ137_16985 [Deltaproteobacteria bacterium]|nr:hypothetical protein [Deltaproteobacteria bacterium]
MEALRELGWSLANIQRATFLLVGSVLCMAIATTAGLLGFHRKVRPGTIRIDVVAPAPTAGLGAADRDALMPRAHDAIVALNVGAGGLGAGSVTIDMGGARATPLGAQARTG